MFLPLAFGSLDGRRHFRILGNSARERDCLAKMGINSTSETSRKGQSSGNPSESDTLLAQLWNIAAREIDRSQRRPVGRNGFKVIRATNLPPLQMARP